MIGYNGSGKSLVAVACAMQHMQAGRPVLSTVRLLDWENPRPCEDVACVSPRHGADGHMAAHPLWVPLTDFRQLFDFTDGHVLMDEVTGVADARDAASMPVQVRNFLPQLRRRQVTLCWTTIHWSFADVRLRRITQAACWAVGLAGKPVPGEMWKRNRLFYWRTYDAKNLPDDFDLAKRESQNIRAMGRAWLWGPRSTVFDAYDSADAVLTLGAADEAGMCLTCGGRRSALRCSCDRVPVQLPAPSLGAPEGTGPDAGVPGGGAAGVRGRARRRRRDEGDDDSAPAPLAEVGSP